MSKRPLNAGQTIAAEVAGSLSFGRVRGSAGPRVRSREQRAAEVVAAADDPGQGQEVPAAERADVVRQRLVDQPLLHGLELSPDVLLEAGEDQADIEVTDLVDAAVVVPGPPQDAAARGL